MSWVIDLFSLAAIGAGLLCFIAAAAGLLRFPDTLSRLHALALADKLGLGLVVAGLLPRADSLAEAAKLLLIWMLALISGALAAQMIAARERAERAAR